MKIKTIIAIILAVCAGVAALRADGDNDAIDNLELSVEDNIATPAVPDKAKPYIKSTIDQLRRHYVKDGYPAELLRNGEVLRLTVPCSRLFAPGATTLKPAASTALSPLGLVVREPQKYKVLITVHSDDTGDTMYSDSITAARANAIDDYLWELAGQQDTNVIPYGIGRDEPVGPNNSIQARSANRRVEFYIIPDTELLRMAGVKVK